MQKSFIPILMLTVLFSGCEKETIEEPVDCNNNPVELQLVSSEDSNCASDDGRVEVAATGGNGQFKYKLGDGAPQSSAVFSDLGAGTYEISAIDGNNCSATLEVAVKNRDGLNIDVQVDDSGGCGVSEGAITITAFDGVEPYAYKLNDGSFGSANNFTGLPHGEYDLIVQDAGGCEVSQPVKVLSGVSFAASVSPIIEGNCAISGCHNGSQSPDLRVFKNIHDNAAKVKTVTGNGSMPQNGTLTQEEIDLIACWVDDGAPEN